MRNDGRRERAVQLRLAGLSRSQIADALSLGSGGNTLSRWLRDVPASEWTRRPNAKDDLRARAVAMRREGRSYREIGAAVGVAKSTLSLWLRDVPLTDEQQRALDLRGPAATTARAEENRVVATRRRTQTQSEARDQITQLSESELFVAGVVAYWAEGTKNKPWRYGTSVTFMNSDPALIQLFLAWLRLIEVSADRLIFRLHIHESADADEAGGSGRRSSAPPSASSGRPRSRGTIPRPSVGTSGAITTAVCWCTSGTALS